MSLRVILPASHDHVTLGQVMQYNRINSDPVAVCRLFCKGDVNQMTYAETVITAQTIVELMNMGEPVFKPFIEIGEITYGFHPDLNGMLVGEFIDMEEFCKEPTQNAHKFMSVIYRPVKRRIANRYEIEPYRPDSIEYHPEAFLDVPYSVYRGALAFFLTLAVGFVSSSSSYSPSPNQKTTISLKRNRQNPIQ